MAFEFTKQKLSAERKAFIKRLVLAGVAGSAGLALGVLTQDMGSIWGIVSASGLASIVFGTGLGAFYEVGYVDDLATASPDTAYAQCSDGCSE